MEKKLNNIPKDDANWMEIQEFCLSFNAYEYWGNFEKAAEVANDHYRKYKENETLSNNLEELRTVLFFEQRRHRHFGNDPDAEIIEYLKRVIKRIGEI